MAYEPEPRKWEQKNWLYEKYWGSELLPKREIAKKVRVTKKYIGQKMEEHGIPSRGKKFEQGNQISPFDGFYNSNENAQTDEQSRKHFDPDVEKTDRSNLPWQKDAKNMDVVGEKAILDS